MNVDQFQRIEALFDAAVELPPGERASYLDRTCPEDSDTRARVMRLLARAEREPVLDIPAEARTDAAAESIEAPGTTVGPYRVLQRIGEGGFGTVYMAEQETPVRRRVALKVIKAGMGSRQVIARFEAERQALAMMEHPGIARVLDAGTTSPEHGERPYFAMERVRGLPITAYCDQHGLGARARLELFTSVCGAVQHAHQKGVIHRDLKPSNVLVTLHDGEAVPKVIDFGIAKATQQPLTDRTFFTEFRQLLGTPEYMSPEQAEMSRLDVDTRSDIYSLGVLLYELLTGTTPFDRRSLRGAPFAEIQRMIREEEPPRPSTRLGTLDDGTGSSHAADEEGTTAHDVARRRATDPRTLRRTLRGDLDWVVMKSLEKDRRRRYDSAAGFAGDVGRYLRREPVTAGPPGVSYRARRFASRHRAAVVGTAAVFVVLVAGVAASTVLAVGQARARRDAERQSAIAGAVNAFLNEDVLGAASPDRTPNRELTVREALDAAARRVPERFRDEPVLEASIHHTLGTTYRQLGEHSAATTHLQMARRLYRGALGDEHPDTLAVTAVLAGGYSEQRRYDEAEVLYAETLAAQRRVLGPGAPPTLMTATNLAAVYKGQHRFDKAEPLLRETLAISRERLGETHDVTLTTTHTLASTYERLGRLSEAEPLIARTVDIRRQLLGADHPDTLSSMNNLAMCCLRQGRYDRAEALLRETLETRRRVLGAEHPRTLVSLNNMGYLFSAQERLAEAEPFYAEVVDMRRRLLGDDHPDTLLSMNNLGSVYTRQERFDLARPLLLEMLATTRRVMTEDHPDIYLSHLTVGRLSLRQGDLEEALKHLTIMEEGLRRALPEGHPAIGRGLVTYGECLMELGRHDEAEATTAEGHRILLERYGAGHPRVVEAERQLLAVRGEEG